MAASVIVTVIAMMMKIVAAGTVVGEVVAPLLSELIFAKSDGSPTLVEEPPLGVSRES